MLKSHIDAWSKIALVGTALALTGPSPTAVKPFAAYHNGASIVFTPELTGTRRLAGFGPWSLGERLSEGKPLDNRLNLYLVVPGTQYRNAAYPQYDHNRIVNKYTVDGKVRDWDIFYCFIIDPSLPADFRSESDLLVAAHQTFRPADLFELSDIPSSEMLAEKLGVNSMNGLRRFRRKNRTLPRLLIVPARLGVRGTAELPDVVISHPPAQQPVQ